MIKYLLSFTFIFLFQVPGPGPYPPGGSSVPGNYAADTAIKLYTFIQQLIYIHKPASGDSIANQRFFSDVFGLPETQYQDFIANYDTLFANGPSFLDVTDPYSQMPLHELQQSEGPCVPLIQFRSAIEHLFSVINELDSTAVINEIINHGVGNEFLPANLKDSLAKDIESLTRLVDKKTEVGGATTVIGGEHNRLVLMLWEMAPFLAGLTVINDEKTFGCSFYKTYVMARQINESIKALDAVATVLRPEILDAILGADKEKIMAALADYRQAATAFNRLGSHVDSVERAAIRRQYANSRVSVMNDLRGKFEGILRKAVSISGFGDIVATFERALTDKKIIQEKVRNYKPYEDPLGKNLDLGNDGERDIWLRAKLDDGILFSQLDDRTRYRRNASLCLIISKNRVRDAEQLMDLFGRELKISADSREQYEPLESVVEIPLGINISDLGISLRDGSSTGVTITYPEEVRQFNIDYDLNEVWGAFKYNKTQMNHLLQVFEMPPSNGYSLTGIIPAAHPDSIRLRFEIATPDPLKELVGTAATVTIALSEIKIAFSNRKELADIGMLLMRKMERRINDRLKELLAASEDFVREQVSEVFFLEQIDSMRAVVTENDHKLEYIISASRFPDFMKEYFVLSNPFQIRLWLSHHQGGMKLRFRHSDISINAGALESFREEIMERAGELNLTFDGVDLMDRLRLRLYAGPVEYDIPDRSIRADVFYQPDGDPVTLGTARFEKGKFRFEPRLSASLIKSMLEDQATAMIEEGENMLSEEVCSRLSTFYLSTIAGWTLDKSASICNRKSFSFTWEKQSDAFSVEGKFVDGVPKITEVNYARLQELLDKDVKAFLGEKLAGIEYIRSGSLHFDGDSFVLPLYLDIDFLPENKLLGQISISIDGKMTFAGKVNLRDHIEDYLQAEVTKVLDDFIGEGVDVSVLDQDITITGISAVSIKDKMLKFKGVAKLFGGIELDFYVLLKRGKISLEIPTGSYDQLVAHQLSLDMGIADVEVSIKPSIKPLGLKGVARVSLYGINFPPVDYLLTRDKLDYTLAPSFTLFGCWPIAPEIVAIDPRITLVAGEKLIRGDVVITIGVSEEARATARMIKVAGFVDLPYTLQQKIEYGGDLILCTVFPLMDGRGEIDIEHSTSTYREKTSKLIRSIVDYRKEIIFNGKKRAFTGESSLKLLGVVSADIELQGNAPAGGSFVMLSGAGRASLPVASFSVTAGTRMIPGPLAPTTAALNAEMTFRLGTDTKLAGLTISSIEGDANIRRARFNATLLGIDFGLMLPGPGDFDEGALLNLLYRMFDLKVDVKALLSDPDLENLIKIKGISLSIPTAEVSGLTLGGRGGNGQRKKEGKRTKHGEEDGSGEKTSTGGSGAAIQARIISPTEKGRRKKEITKCFFGLFCETETRYISFEKFSPNGWPGIFSNCPTGYKSGSMIFNPDKSHPKTGNEIQSLVATINVDDERSPFNVHTRRDEYTFLFTSIPAGTIYPAGANSYSFCQDSTVNRSLRVNSSTDLSTFASRHHYNLAFDKKADKTYLFVSYRLTESPDTKTTISLTKDYYKSQLKASDVFSCPNCVIVDTSMYTTIAPAAFSGSLKIYKREDEKGINWKKYREIKSGELLSDIKLARTETKGSMFAERHTLREGAGLAKVLNDRLSEIDPALWEYLIIENDLVYSTDSLINLKRIVPQTSEENDKLYALTGKVWIEINREVFEYLLAKRNTQVPEGDIQTWLNTELSEEGDDQQAFRNILQGVLDELLRTNGDIKVNMFSCDDLGVDVMVLNGRKAGMSDGWNPDGFKTFIVKRSENEALIKEGTSFAFDRNQVFGDAYDNVSPHFATFPSFKNYFENGRPLLRNFILANLIMKNNPVKYGKIADYYGVYYRSGQMLLARFNKLEDDYAAYSLLEIKEGPMDPANIDDHFRIDENPRLFLHRIVLSADNYDQEVPDLNLYGPLANGRNVWDAVFEGHSDEAMYYISEPPSAPGPFLSVLRYQPENDLKLLWWKQDALDLSELETARLELNYARYLRTGTRAGTSMRNSGFPFASDDISPKKLLLLFDKSLDNSNRWFDTNTFVNPLVFLKRTD